MSEFEIYLQLGVNHIADLNAYDHIVFIIALCAVYQLRQWRTVLMGGLRNGGQSYYALDITEDAREEDKIIEQSGITLSVDRKSYVFLAGTVLDYSGGLNGKGFVFNNPNAKKACGCGTSFSV